MFIKGLYTDKMKTTKYFKRKEFLKIPLKKEKSTTSLEKTTISSLGEKRLAATLREGAKLLLMLSKW